MKYTLQIQKYICRAKYFTKYLLKFHKSWWNVEIHQNQLRDTFRDS